ncbi:MAG: hypothetical protein ACRD2J_02530 [Thermoanaerobaculia bacterium]
MAPESEERPEGVRYGLLYGVAISLLVEYGMLKFYIAHSGRFTQIEDYIQFGLATLFAIFFAVLGVRYLTLFIGDLRNR